MKVILTGGTGFVGSEVLRQLADDPAVTMVTYLSSTSPAPPRRHAEPTLPLRPPERVVPGTGLGQPGNWIVESLARQGAGQGPRVSI